MRAMTTLMGLGAIALAAPSSAQQSDLAQQLANPVASLISVPFQFNFDSDIGPLDDGDRFTLNFQPVVPFDISENYNLISRTILPYVSQDDVAPGAGSQSGIGDIVQSLFFSPKTTASGWIFGYGPVLLIPTGTEDRLTADKWGVGPTFVGLKQSGPWTYGALLNHIVSIAGESDRSDISSTFVQPFLSYTTPNAFTYSVNAEVTYDWKTDQASVPISLGISKVTSIGSRPVSIGGNIRNWVNTPETGPEGWALRFSFTLLYPQQ